MGERYYFKNLGYVMDDVPEELLIKLKKIVNEKNLDKHNKDLAGNIEKEYLIPKALGYFEQYIMSLCKAYDEEFNYINSIDVNKNRHPFFLDQMWVNFQKKHEFNPIHTHTGVFSFVIWLQVPYTKEQEQENSPGKHGNTNVPGCFSFHYTNALGEINNEIIHADKSYEGKICLFPSKLRHSVSPFFSSDDYRISVSGNIMIEV
jgi:hypothetical protein|tara:strand:- start:2954 stop:3565 length:612 start_codon:yes stop_codon:yes gene_type:complete